ncbi:helix-turn-helix domain-containing protein [Terribacillus saccharophilus]|uniref:helix-turn-helix domain-containing protein n=1 Tax=Terribacillus saccharophilus TaxID=361277 RepID=UPI003981D490
MTGEEFQVVRLYMGLTQAQFAEMLGISEASVSFMERGQRNVSAATIAKISKKFQVTDDYLAFKSNRKRLAE